MGGGLALLWSWWGALFVALALLSLYTVARAMTSSSNVDATRGRLDQLRADLLDMRAIVEHPESPESQARGRELLSKYHLDADAGTDTPPTTPSTTGDRGAPRADGAGHDEPPSQLPEPDDPGAAPR